MVKGIIFDFNGTVLWDTQYHNKAWNIFLEKYHLSEHEAINALKKYHWFISPNMDMFVVFRVVNICKSENTHKQKEINNLFYDYFLEDSCQNLVDLVENWESNHLFKRRMKIFKDCVKGENVLKKNMKIKTTSNKKNRIFEYIRLVNEYIFNKDAII